MSTQFTTQSWADIKKVASCLDAHTEGTILVDAEVKIHWISEKYCSLLGVSSSAQVIGKTIEDIIFHSLMRQVVTSGRPILLDLMHANGHCLVVTRFPVRDKNGRVTGAIGLVFHDHAEQLKPLVDKYSQVLNTRTTAERSLASQRTSKYSFADIIGSSHSLRNMVDKAKRAAKSDTNVMLLGETGTGKELVAHAIHQASSRQQKAFVAVNMAAIPENLLEVEFFGAEAGAYTGLNKKGRQGKFLLADGGTLFLDEIGDTPLALQSKLLRVLQEQEIEPIGGNKVININVRVIAATSRNLDKLVEEGLFRADLRYRLDILTLDLPPLRERLEDIPQLANSMLAQISSQLGNKSCELSGQALTLLQHYSWPGNLRELRNVLERACIFTSGNELTERDFTQLAGVSTPPPPNIEPLTERLNKVEKQALLDALSHTKGNRSKAATLLQISRANFYEKLNKHGISRAVD